MNRSVGLKTLALACSSMLVLMSAAARAADELPPPLYWVKHEEPKIGSHIPRRAVWSSDIPINRRYAELTPEEQAIVKSKYESMGPGDEPPYPIDGLVRVFEAVRSVQGKLYPEGKVSMFIEVDAQGQAVSASVMTSPDPKLTQALASILMLTKYKPALCAGVPCQMGYPFRMTFSIDR